MRRRSVLFRCALCCAVLIALATGCGDDGGGDEAATTTTTTTAVPTSESTEVGHTDAEREAFAVQPVLASGPCPVPVPAVPTTTAEPQEGDSPSTTRPEGLPGDQFPTLDGRFCYRLGPPMADANDLIDATVSSNEGQWQVFARVAPESLDALNGSLDECFNGGPGCPPGEGGRGYVAFVWDGRVLYATSVGTEDLADGGLLLGGGMTERRARDLLALINR